MTFISNYGLFLAKFATIVASILIILLAIAFIQVTRMKQKIEGKIKIKHLNEKYLSMKRTLEQAFIGHKSLKNNIKQDHKRLKKLREKGTDRNKLFVIQFHGDIKASEVQELREIVTAILLVAKPTDEVLVKLESPGGLVHAYGLAASQLQRIREKKIPLTIAIDKVAASGGYMMACVANKIIAAPFAIIGSIGVLLQLPNFHRFLKEHRIDFEQLSAGEYKRTVSLFGENTKKGREKIKAELEEIHQIFKAFIHENRPALDVDSVATGEHWLGYKALELRLIDKIMTSDDYLMSLENNHDIFEISLEQKKSLTERLTKVSNKALTALATYW